VAAVNKLWGNIADNKIAVNKLCENMDDIKLCVSAATLIYFNVKIENNKYVKPSFM